MSSTGRNLVLTGLMGSGKSSVGRLLAERLRRPFVDTDDLVQLRAGRTISELWRLHQEDGFRRLEAAAVRTIAQRGGQVVALGGGAVLDPANVAALRASGDLVLLDATPRALATRLTGDGSRPLLAGADDLVARLAELRRVRAKAYRDAADHSVDTTDLDPERVTEAVLRWARTHPGLLVGPELRDREP